jgi:hypothetical protein
MSLAPNKINNAYEINFESVVDNERISMCIYDPEMDSRTIHSALSLLFLNIIAQKICFIGCKICNNLVIIEESYG